MSTNDNAIVVEAANLPLAMRKPLKADVALVRYNAKLAIAAIAPHFPLLRTKLKRVDDHGPQLLALIDALQVANNEVLRTRPTAAGVRKLAQPVYAARELLMNQLTSWGAANLIDSNEVRRIKEGRGSIDAAQDVIDIADIVKKHPNIKDKLLCSQAELDVMVEQAHALIAAVRPVESHRRSSEARKQAISMQSAIWTLVLRQYELLWQQGAMIFGMAVGDALPVLGARVYHSSKQPVVVPPVGPS